jgi:hypothetical protein
MSEDHDNMAFDDEVSVKECSWVLLGKSDLLSVGGEPVPTGVAVLDWLLNIEILGVHSGSCMVRLGLLWCRH